MSTGILAIQFSIETSDENEETKTSRFLRYLINRLNPWRRKFSPFFHHFYFGLATIGIVVLICYMFFHVNNVDCDHDFNYYDEKYDNDMVVHLLSNETQELDPCDNFFHFACQQWNKDNPRIDDKYYWSIDGISQNRRDQLFIEMMEEEEESDDIPAYKEAKNFYKNCMDFKLNNSGTNLDTAMGVWLKTLETYGNSNQDVNPPGSTECGKYVEEIFRIAVGQKYLMRTKTIGQLEEILKEMKTIADDVRKQISKMLNTSAENQVERTFEPENFDSIGTCLGYPDWIFNNSRVQEEYSELTLDQATFPDQFLHAVKWALDRKIERNGKIDKDSAGMDKECLWDTFPGGGVSHFDNKLYQIYIPMGEFENVLNATLAIKYGSKGFTFGHEYSHALYELGWKTNKNGSLTSLEKCLKNQYDHFTVKGLWDIFLDGKRTLEENFADNVGLKAAYLAYKKSTSSSAPEELEGFPGKYTGDQLFFLGYAQEWCDSYTLEEISSFMEAYAHSPNIFRVLGPLQNSREFAEAWNCPAGTKMNPYSENHSKCLVFME